MNLLPPSKAAGTYRDICFAIECVGFPRLAIRQVRHGTTATLMSLKFPEQAILIIVHNISLVGENQTWSVPAS